MTLIPISEAARRNDITRQRASQLVRAGQIPGAVRIGTYWAVPDGWVYEKQRVRKTRQQCR